MFIESFVCGQTCQQHMCGQEAVLICNIVDSQHTNVGTGLNSGPLGWTTGPETTAQFNKRLLRQCAASATLSTEAAIFTIHTNIPTYQHTNIPTYHHHRPQGGGTRRTIPPPQATGGGWTMGGEGGGAWGHIYIYIYM